MTKRYLQKIRVLSAFCVASAGIVWIGQRIWNEQFGRTVSGRYHTPFRANDSTGIDHYQTRFDIEMWGAPQILATRVSGRLWGFDEFERTMAESGGREILKIDAETRTLVVVSQDSPERIERISGEWKGAERPSGAISWAPENDHIMIRQTDPGSVGLGLEIRWGDLTRAVSAAAAFPLIVLILVTVGLDLCIKRVSGWLGLGEGRCPECGYDLRASSETGCPECGRGR